MKIILLAGQSGSGKTSVGRELAKNEDKYNFVHSYTDRQMRETNEYGHTFVDSKEMDSLLKRDDIKDVCSKILAAVDTNGLSTITETLELIVHDGILYLKKNDIEPTINVVVTKENIDGLFELTKRLIDFNLPFRFSYV